MTEAEIKDLARKIANQFEFKSNYKYDWQSVNDGVIEALTKYGSTIEGIPSHEFADAIERELDKTPKWRPFRRWNHKQNIKALRSK